MCACVYVCVHAPPRPLITRGMIWCDIDHVCLVKQVMTFSAFQLPYMTLAINKMDVALVTQHVMNTCQEDYGNMVLATVGILDSSNKTES